MMDGVSKSPVEFNPVRDLEQNHIAPGSTEPVNTDPWSARREQPGRRCIPRFNRKKSECSLSPIETGEK